VGFPTDEAAIRRNYLISLVLSLVIVLTGIIWTLQIGRQSNRLDHAVFHLQEERDSLVNALRRVEAHRP
jgi:uncharacterized membrane protein YqjE